MTAQTASLQVQQTLTDTYKAVHMSSNLMDRLKAVQRTTAAVMAYNCPNYCKPLACVCR